MSDKTTKDLLTAIANSLLRSIHLQQETSSLLVTIGTKIESIERRLIDLEKNTANLEVKS